MDEEKTPMDILDEIMNRSEKPLPSPASSPPRFEPPSPEDIPPPPPMEKKPPPAERRLPWLCALLGGAAVAGLLCAVLLTSLNQRLDRLGAAVDEIQTVDELREENERLLQENADLQAEVDEQSSQFNQYSFEESLRYQRMKYRMSQSEYLYYMEQFVEQGDLSMAALVMVLEDDILRPPGESEPERLIYGGAMVPPLDSIHQERYDELRRLLEEKGVLYSSGMGKQNGTAPLWPSGTGPSEDPDMAALGILWCAMDAHFVQGDDHAASQYLCLYLGDPNKDYQERAEGLADGFTLRQYQMMKDELVEDKWLTIGEDGAMSEGFGPYGGKTSILYTLPFDLPANPWDSTITRKR